MKNLIFGFILISIAGLTNELVAQKTKSLASRRATKLEATLNSDIAKLRKTVDEKIAKLESEFNKEASALIEYAENAVKSGDELSPSEIVMLTAKSQEFMFHSQLTSNVANRTADGLQQLFRQQSWFSYENTAADFWTGWHQTLSDALVLHFNSEWL